MATGLAEVAGPLLSMKSVRNARSAPLLKYSPRPMDPRQDVLELFEMTQSTRSKSAPDE